MENGYVTDVVKNWCDPGLGPRSQTFLTWIEIRRNPADDWLVASRVGITRELPDSTGETYKLRNGRCQADVEYGTAWRAHGTDHRGVPFDTGTVRKLSGATGLC